MKIGEAFIGIYTIYKKMTYNPPTLYAKSSTGKSMQWSIEVEETMGGAIIRTRHGYEGGKIQVNEKTITVGKNIGRANAAVLPDPVSAHPITSRPAKIDGLQAR